MVDEQKVEPTRVTVKPALAVKVDGRSGTAPEEIGKAMESAFGALEGYRAKHDLAYAGPPRAIYTSYDDGGTSFIVAIPVSALDAEPAAEDGVRVGELPGGPALRFTHEGPYERLMGTYDGITDWLKAEGMLESEADWVKYMPMWEEYVDDPTTTPPEELKTHIYVPLPNDG